jgi:Na+/H+ antiporter NhaD/arsenite permease-like protein
LLGVSLLLLTGLAGLGEAFGVFVDWNIISILLGMWIISYHLVRSGFPELIVSGVSRYIRSSRDIALLLAFIAGLISLAVDNVLVVMLITPLAVSIARAYRVDSVPIGLLAALTANATGTALLLGDLPPQLLHSIFRAEFVDFIYMHGRPSSFPILIISILATLYISARILIPARSFEISQPVELKGDNASIYRGYLYLSISMFSIAIVLMSLRREISIALGREIPLGVFPLSVAIIGSIVADKIHRSEFREAIEKGIDWSAILFYITLFILVGSLEKWGGLEPISMWLASTLSNLFTGYTAIYWISAPVVAFVEHDAYILVMLKSIKDAEIENPWPFAWALLWSGTLGSNYTAAGAPALYVAFRILEKETGAKLRPKEIYRVTSLYSTISLVITYAISIPIWGI